MNVKIEAFRIMTLLLFVGLQTEGVFVEWVPEPGDLPQRDAEWTVVDEGAAGDNFLIINKYSYQNCS